MPRKILHVDLDAFFCAVEEQHDPSLIGKAFAVGGLPSERGVVASCSYAARHFGVRSAMPMARALKLCPELLVVPARHGRYSEVSDSVIERLYRFTALVEQISIDEAFLDVSDLTEESPVIAKRLQAAIQDELGLPCSLGAATNKLVAKIATDIGKASARGLGPPSAITVVPPGEEAAFLARLPIEALWGVGPKTALQLHELGIWTIGDVARWQESDLVNFFGRFGAELAARSKGLDDRPVVTSHETKSISQEITFTRDIDDGAELYRTLRELSERVGRRLRRADLVGNTIKLKIRWPDFTTLTRQVTLDEATDQDNEIYAEIRQLFGIIWQPGKKVRLLGVGVSGLRPPVRQLRFWDQGSDKERRLQKAIDELQERFGRRSIHRGRHLRPTAKKD